jgi:hypothetical protein
MRTEKFWSICFFRSAVHFFLILALIVGSCATSVKADVDCTFSFGEVEVFGYRISNQESFTVCAFKDSSAPVLNGLVAGIGTHQISIKSATGGEIEFSFRAAKPGVYKFFAPGYGSRHVLVGNPKSDLRRFMSDLGYLYLHGNRDDALDNKQLQQLATWRKLSVTCGTISRFIQAILEEFRIESRIAVSITLQKLNGLDDGHIMLEIKTKKGWALFDPDSRTYFGNENKLLSVADLQSGFSPKLGSNINTLGPLLLIDNSGFQTSNGEDLSILEERSRISPKSLSNWYRRVVGRIGVLKNGKYHFKTERNSEVRQRILSQYPNSVFVSGSAFRR